MNPLFFSVDRVAVGLPGSDVHSQAQLGVEEAAGDVYTTLPPFGSNSLFIDEEKLGLTSGFFGDDLDALELDSELDRWTYFSIDSLSATNGYGAGNLANDILISDRSGGFGIFAPGEVQVLPSGDRVGIGLDPFDDLDALALWDVFHPGELNPGHLSKIFRSSVINAPIDEVWARIRDFNALPDWHPAFTDSHIEKH